MSLTFSIITSGTAMQSVQIARNAVQFQGLRERLFC